MKENFKSVPSYLNDTFFRNVFINDVLSDMNIHSDEYTFFLFFLHENLFNEESKHPKTRVLVEHEPT